MSQNTPHAGALEGCATNGDLAACLRRVPIHELMHRFGDRLRRRALRCVAAVSRNGAWEDRPGLATTALVTDQYGG